MPKQKQRIVSASDFKSHCLEYLKCVGQEDSSYLVTKRGKPIAELKPIRREAPDFFPGKMRDLFTIKGDLLEPIAAEWDVLSNES